MKNTEHSVQSIHTKNKKKKYIRDNKLKMVKRERALAVSEYLPPVREAHKLNFEIAERVRKSRRQRRRFPNLSLFTAYSATGRNV